MQNASIGNLWKQSVSQGSTPGGIRMKGRELLNGAYSGAGTIGGFGGASLTTTAIVSLHPSRCNRLAQIAKTYDEYFFHSATITFVPNQPTTVPGNFFLGYDPNPGDSAWTSAIMVMSNFNSAMSNTYATSCIQILGKMARTNRFLTDTTVTAEQNLNQIYQGNIHYAFQGWEGIAGTLLGFLVITYDVEFFSPQNSA